MQGSTSLHLEHLIRQSAFSSLKLNTGGGALDERRPQMSNEPLFEIKEHIGIISRLPYGYQRELNLISWNGMDPKYDIRDWSEDHQKLSRGITLTEDEMNAICDLLRKR